MHKILLHPPLENDRSRCGDGEEDLACAPCSDVRRASQTCPKSAQAFLEGFKLFQKGRRVNAPPWTAPEVGAGLYAARLRCPGLASAKKLGDEGALDRLHTAPAQRCGTALPRAHEAARRPPPLCKRPAGPLGLILPGRGFSRVFVALHATNEVRYPSLRFHFTVKKSDLHYKVWAYRTCVWNRRHWPHGRLVYHRLGHRKTLGLQIFWSGRCRRGGQRVPPIATKLNRRFWLMFHHRFEALRVQINTLVRGCFEIRKRLPLNLLRTIFPMMIENLTLENASTRWPRYFRPPAHSPTFSTALSILQMLSQTSLTIFKVRWTIRPQFTWTQMDLILDAMASCQRYPCTTLRRKRSTS